MVALSDTLLLVCLFACLLACLFAKSREGPTTTTCRQQQSTQQLYIYGIQRKLVKAASKPKLVISSLCLAQPFALSLSLSLSLANQQVIGASNGQQVATRALYQLESRALATAWRQQGTKRAKMSPFEK